MLPQEVLNKVILVRHTLVVRGEIMAITHHGLEPRGLAVQVFDRWNLAAENTVVAVLLKLAGKHQAGAVKRKDVKVIDQDGHAHALTEHLDRLDVGERTGTHAKRNNVE